MTSEELTKHVQEVFTRELDALKNKDLQQQVVRTWVRAMEISGATDLPRELPKPGIGLEHVLAVVQIAMAIADAEAQAHRMTIDRDVVIAGALLHDVGKLLERAPADRHPLAGKLIRHPFSGLQLALEQGVPSEVLHIIAYHSAEGHRVPRTLECYIVYEADMLSVDALDRRELGISRGEQIPYIYVPGLRKKGKNS
ncbi:hypothetical protein ANRL1_02464 [Anaerolineae bacterium]|nr:hypothetical protein ANRL1_02464 [Anaerolineae bacterium]